MKALAGSLFCVALAGCVPPLTTLPVEGERSTQRIQEPAIGMEAKVTVGESLLRAGVLTTITRSKARLKADATGSMDMGYQMKAAAGTELTVKRRVENGFTLACLDLLGISGKVISCLVDRTGTRVFDSSTFAVRDKYFPLDKPVPYTVQPGEVEQVENQPDFHVDALYQGLAKGVIKISFREFKGGLARPAFTQDVNYELEADGTGLVAFRNIRIKVLKATGTELRYIVERFS